MKSSNRLTWKSPRALVLAAACAFLGVASSKAAYPDLILSNNPVAYYRLEELPGDSVAVDATTNHFDASYAFDLDTNGVPDFPQLGLPGITTNSILFHVYTDASSIKHSGSVTIDYRPELSPTLADGQHGAPFSVECWVQANTQPADYSVPLAMFGTYESGPPYGNASGWNFYQSPGPASFWIFNMKNGPFAQASSIPITLLEWYHLAATFDGDAVVFYVNGVSAGSFGGNSAYLADHLSNGQIGAGSNTGFLPFDGGVDEVAFYTNVLSASTILSHYMLGTNSFRAVATPPGFLQLPASATNYSGTKVTFTAVGNGTTPLHYQWKRNSTPIADATNATYSFVSTFPADNGAMFSVMVTNSVGMTNSPAVTLTVLTNLNIVHNPYGPITRNVGSKAAFRVVANGALPITYQWYKVVDATTNKITGATSDTLWLSNLQLSADLSSYYARVSGPFETNDTEAATLFVQTRPVAVPITGYAKIVSVDDPVAFWRLDESDGSTTATDAIGSFDGSYTGGGTFTFQVPTGIPHETNTAVNITQGAVVSIPYALELNPVTGPWTAEAWVKPATLDPDHFRTVFSSVWNPNFGANLYGWNVYQHVAGVWTLNLYNGGGGGSFVSDFVHNPIIPNSWYHMVIADDLTTIHFYVNGVQVLTVDRNGFGFIPNGINGDVTVAGAPTVLGQRADNAFDPFDGSIDDVAFYNKALTAQQVQLHYANSTKLSISKSGSNIIISWPVGTLQSSDTVNGAYTDVMSATSPWTNAPAMGNKFYRVKLQ